MTTTIEQLHNLVADDNLSEADRKTAAEHILKLQGQDSADLIADDDQELAQLMSNADGPLPIANVCLDLYGFDIRTKEGAKKMFARLRKEAAIKATVGNEELPMAQRITAVQSWRDLQPRPETWQNINDLDLIEKLTPHPDLARLKELSQLVCDAKLTEGADWKAYIREMKTAIDEFNQLRGKYPLRYAPVMVSLKSLHGVAYQITGDVQADEAALRQRLAYIDAVQKESGA